MKKLKDIQWLNYYGSQFTDRNKLMYEIKEEIRYLNKCKQEFIYKNDMFSAAYCSSIISWLEHFIEGL
jgi:hypothetical protein